MTGLINSASRGRGEAALAVRVTSAMVALAWAVLHAPPGQAQAAARALAQLVLEAKP